MTAVPIKKSQKLGYVIFLHSFLLLFYSGVSFSEAHNALGTRKNPIKIIILQSNQSTKSFTKPKVFSECLEKKSGYSVNISLSNSNMTVVESIGSKRADVAIAEILSYLRARQKYGVQAVLKVSHFNKTFYKSMIIVRTSDYKNKVITSVKDLKGKKFGYSDESSASSFLLPASYMKDHDISPVKMIRKGSVEAAITSLVQNQVDAASGYYEGVGEKQDARHSLLTTHPDIYKSTRIIWTSNPIPNEPIIVRKDLKKEIDLKRLVIALQGCVSDYPNFINNIDKLVKISNEREEYLPFVKLLKSNDFEFGKKLNFNEKFLKNF